MTTDQIVEVLTSKYANIPVFQGRPYQDELVGVTEFFVVRATNEIRRDITNRALRQVVLVQYATTNIDVVGINAVEVIEALNKKGLYFDKSGEQLGSIAGIDAASLLISFEFTRQIKGCVM